MGKGGHHRPAARPAALVSSLALTLTGTQLKVPGPCERVRGRGHAEVYQTLHQPAERNSGSS